MNDISQEGVRSRFPGFFGALRAMQSQFETPAVFAHTAEIKGAALNAVKVLVVDDEQLIADTLTAILNISGYEARAVYSGRAAINAVNFFEPDVLISDVMMPEMSGIEAAIAILTLRPSCKVVLFSGQAATVDLLQEARAQGHDFEILAKPIHPKDLLQKAKRWWNP